MNERLNELVQDLRRCESGESGDCASPAAEACHLSDGERRFVALASGAERLLDGEESAIEAWYALPPQWRAAICLWRGWPGVWAEPLPSEEG